MNLATKAALYNALLFPGCGHFYLKKYVRATMLFIPALAGLLFICRTVMQAAYNFLKSNPLPAGTADVSSVIKLSMDSIKAIPEQGIATSYSVLLILVFMSLLWIFSIIDAYHLGKKKMQED